MPRLCHSSSTATATSAARVVRHRDVAGDAHDLVCAGRERGERLVFVMVDIGQLFELVLAQPGDWSAEPAASRLLAEARERLGQSIAVRAGEWTNRDAGWCE